MDTAQQKTQVNYTALTCVLFFVMVLTITPTPSALSVFWPDWVLLMCIFFASKLPRTLTPIIGLCIGVLIEVLLVKSFGVYGLCIASLVWFINKIHQQFNMLSVWQQSVIVVLCIVFTKLILIWLYGLISGMKIFSYYWYSIFGDIIAWPLICAFFQRFPLYIRIKKNKDW